MELKNCPFCGEKVVATTEDFFYELLKEHGSAAIEIECTNFECGCQFWTYHRQHQSNVYEVALEVAAERWNGRAEVETSEGL